jgi:hypothetical protein
MARNAGATIYATKVEWMRSWRAAAGASTASTSGPGDDEKFTWTRAR